MTPERIARLWTVLNEGLMRASVAVGPALTRAGQRYVELRCADLFGTPVRAYGLTDDEALGALWDLVVLHARVRRDEINAALAAEGLRV